MEEKHGWSIYNKEKWGNTKEENEYYSASEEDPSYFGLFWTSRMSEEWKIADPKEEMSEP